MTDTPETPDAPRPLEFFTLEDLLAELFTRGRRVLVLLEKPGATDHDDDQLDVYNSGTLVESAALAAMWSAEYLQALADLPDIDVDAEPEDDRE